MADVVARSPLSPSPDVVATPDSAEQDTWARAPVAPAPDVVAYGRGPIADVVEEVVVPGGTATGDLPDVLAFEPEAAATGRATTSGALATVTASTVSGTAGGRGAASGAGASITASTLAGSATGATVVLGGGGGPASMWLRRRQMQPRPGLATGELGYVGVFAPDGHATGRGRSVPEAFSARRRELYEMRARRRRAA